MLYSLLGFAGGAAITAITFLLTRRRGADESEFLSRLEAFDRAQERQEKMFRDEFGRVREESSGSSRAQREELGGALKNVSETTLKSLTEISGMLRDQLDQVTGQARRLTDNVDARLKELREENTGQLEKMRATVDEKLQGTLEKRLGESFKLVSDRLEQVHQGLGAMRQLASDVGGSAEGARQRENARRLGRSAARQSARAGPHGRSIRAQCQDARRQWRRMSILRSSCPGDENGAPVWLPIDAKFPTEDYQRLLAAQDKGDVDLIEGAMKGLETQLRKNAKDICAKYINPPRTTDFALMFLPTEGLYAEAIRRIGLVEQVQRDCRVVFAGPTTLAALLNSLQMGFRTLAIQKASSEVWNLLAGVKTEFGKFGEALSKVKEKLDQASRDMDEVDVRSRAIYEAAA